MLKQVENENATGQRKKFNCIRCGYKFSVNVQRYSITCPWCGKTNEV